MIGKHERCLLRVFGSSIFKSSKNTTTTHSLNRTTHGRVSSKHGHTGQNMLVFQGSVPTLKFYLVCN